MKFVYVVETLPEDIATEVNDIIEPISTTNTNSSNFSIYHAGGYKKSSTKITYSYKFD